MEEAPLFSLAGMSFTANVVDVYDGDTATVVFNPFPEDPTSKDFAFKVRLLGYNSPEMRPRKTTFRRKRVIRNAKIAKKALSDLILNKEILLECAKFDSFGRILGTIHVDNVIVNNYMIDRGYGVRF